MLEKTLLEKSYFRKTFFSAFLSNFLEFYDFCLMGTFIVIISNQFFPGSEMESILTGLSIFGISFLARPLGALFFGYLGDSLGRRVSLIFSTLLMGLSTFLIGCLPTYDTIGIAAPILLIIFRLLQGFSLGGESSGSFIFLLESVKIHRGFLTSLILAGGTFGMLISNLQGIIFLQDTMPNWAWRIPFLMGILISFISLFFRLSLGETPEFQEKKGGRTWLSDVFNMLKYNKRNFFSIFCLGFVNSSLVYILVVYIGLFISKFADFKVSYSLTYPQIGMISCFLVVPVVGRLSDIIGCRKIIITGCIMLFLASFVIPYLLSTGYFVFSCFFLSLLIGALNAPAPLFMYKLLPVNIRYTGLSLGFSLGTAFGALTPFYLTFLETCVSNIFICIEIYILFMAFVGFVSVLQAKSIENPQQSKEFKTEIQSA